MPSRPRNWRTFSVAPGLGPAAAYSATDSWHAHEIAIPTSDQQAPASCILTLAADPAVATMISADQPTVVVMKSCQELCANEFSGDH
jgi:hypothetical protein